MKKAMYVIVKVPQSSKNVKMIYLQKTNTKYPPQSRHNGILSSLLMCNTSTHSATATTALMVILWLCSCGCPRNRPGNQCTIALDQCKTEIPTVLKYVIPYLVIHMRSSDRRKTWRTLLQTWKKSDS